MAGIMTFERWFASATNRHGPAAASALLALALAGWLLGEVGLASQLAVLLLALTLLGPPQAVRDPEIGQALFEERRGAPWTVWFFAFYAGLAGLVLIGWLTIPSVTFLAVCALTGLKLGRDAAKAHRRPDDHIVILTYAALPFVLPAAFHPDAIGTLWAWITRQPDPGELLAFTHAAAPLLAVVWCTFAGLVGGRFLRKTGTVMPLVELVVAGVLFGLAPPIIALAGYLTVVQAIPRLMHLADPLGPGDWGRALAELMRDGAPLAGAAVVLAGFALVLARVLGASPAQALAVVTVWGFSAFVVPHVIVQALDPGPRRSTDFFEAPGLLDRIRDMLGGRRRRVLRERSKVER